VDIYKLAIRPLLFQGIKVDPEFAHQQSMKLLSSLSHQPDRPPNRWVIQQIQRTCCFRHPSLEQTLWNIPFANPFGLAAGFDKDGIAAAIWPSFGFGFTELGTVTLHAQPGNPQPRLFRLVEDEAVLNRMGFNNEGAAALADRLSQLALAKLASAKTQSSADVPQFQPAIPIGINLGKSKVTELEEAAADYLGSFRLLKDLGDYFVVNVSSPNTPGLRSLQATDQLAPILAALQQENQANKPLLVKIAPDLDWDAIAAVLDLAQAHNLAGVIATNTTIRRDHLKTQTIAQTGNPITEEAGGISGAPLRQRSTEVIRFIYQQTQGRLPIIGVGGIFTATDAWEKILAGASLVQVYTGWIYEGPWMVQRVLRGLVEKLEERGVERISDIVGKGEV
jgi:dihydroorotate dehydrogenase